MCKRWVRVTNHKTLYRHGSGRTGTGCSGWGSEPTELMTEASPELEAILQQALDAPHVARGRPVRKVEQ